MAFGALAYDPMTGLAITPEEPDPRVPAVATPQGPFSKAINRLAGTQFGELRMQTWPEKLVRSAATLPGDVASGEQPMLPPGLRREDYTDAAPPSGLTVATQPNDPAMERAQDLAGMAGGGMMFGRLAPSAETAAASLARPMATPSPPREARAPAPSAAVLLADSAAPGAPIAALEHAPKFYSGLERAVEAIPQPKMTGEQWLGTLNNRGVKPEEMDWTGLRGFLAERGNQPVTKAQVAEHLGANKLELGEAHKGDISDPLVNYLHESYGPATKHIQTSQDVADARKFNSAFRETTKGLSDEEVISAARKSEQFEGVGDTKFQSYQLPGGENYREKLLTLPRNKFTESDLPQGWRVEPTPHSTGGSFRIMAEGESSPMGYGETRQSAIEQALAENKINPKASEFYSSSHWDEPNVLVHRRTNERDVNGTPSLHIEEIQSDFLQDYRKQKVAIGKAIDQDFDGIAAKMVDAGAIKRVCD